MAEKTKLLQIIHLALCASVIVAYAILGGMTLEKLKQFPSLDASSLPFLAIPVLAVVLSNVMFKTRLKQIDPKLKLEEKFPHYQVASLLRWAILESAAFIILMLKPDFIVLGLLLIIYLITLRPTEDKMKLDLQK